MWTPKEGEYVEERLVQINSRDTTGTGSKFTYIFRWPYKNVRSVTLLRGHIPYTTEKLINYDITEFTRKNIDTAEGHYSGVLRWDLASVIPGRPISLIDHDERSNTSRLFISSLDRITMRMCSDQGNEIDFGADNIRISSITPGNPTTVTCATAHGLSSGDTVYIGSVDNGSSIAANRLINARHVITFLNLSQFTIPINTLLELPVQIKTGQEQPYVLGSHATVTNVNGSSMGVAQLFAHASGTRVVMKNTFGSGPVVSIAGMDNGIYFSDNERINRRHDIVEIVDEYSFVIPVTLSGYPVTQQKTGDNPAYTLGSSGVIKVEKLQTSFDFCIVTTGEKSNLSNRYVQPGPDSMYEALSKNSQ